MCVILQTWCQIQRTSSSLRCRDCGPGHIQCSYSSTYLGFNSKRNVSPPLLEICRVFNAPYTANFTPNTAHILQFTLSGLWPRPYTMWLQLHIFSLQYSTERICAAMRDISTLECASYCKRAAKYSAHPPVYAMPTVVTDIYNVFTAPHIQSSIFNWTCLRCCWRYIDNSMCAILQTWCQMQCTSSSSRYLNCGPGHVLSKHSSTYWVFNIQLNVSALLSVISRQLNALRTANVVPNIAQILQFTLFQLWSRPYIL
jgi:hypothetical protein